MPTYEYECKKCGHVFERFQRITETPVSECPECCGKVARLPGAGAGIIFKGSGFYATDYRSNSYRRSAEAEKPKPDVGATGKGPGVREKTSGAPEKRGKGAGKGGGEGRTGKGESRKGEGAQGDSSGKH